MRNSHGLIDVDSRSPRNSKPHLAADVQRRQKPVSSQPWAANPSGVTLQGLG